MSERNTRKRARTSSTNKNSNIKDVSQASQGVQAEVRLEEREKGEEFWYDDGNIVVVARDVGFRIYKGLLADCSPVLKDMFSTPQTHAASSSAADLTHDVCPVVHVSDSPEDFRYLLRFYMPRTDSSPFVSDDPSYDMISAAVRLGQKYQMTRLLEHAVRYLKTYYTNDFAKWVDGAQYGPPGFAEVHSLGVVNLARLAGERSILPTALLRCCMLRGAAVHGFEREDGSREQLTLDDIEICFVAKSRLIRESVRIALCVFEPTASRKCKKPSECVFVFNALVRALQKHVEDIATPDPFAPFYAILSETRKELCSQCADMIKERDLHERRASWDRLSELLGIDEPSLNVELPNDGVADTG